MQQRVFKSRFRATGLTTRTSSELALHPHRVFTISTCSPWAAAVLTTCNTQRRSRIADRAESQSGKLRVKQLLVEHHSKCQERLSPVHV